MRRTPPRTPCPSISYSRIRLGRSGACGRRRGTAARPGAARRMPRLPVVVFAGVFSQRTCRPLAEGLSSSTGRRTCGGVARIAASTSAATPEEWPPRAAPRSAGPAPLPAPCRYPPAPPGAPRPPAGPRNVAPLSDRTASTTASLSFLSASFSIPPSPSARAVPSRYEQGSRRGTGQSASLGPEAGPGAERWAEGDLPPRPDLLALCYCCTVQSLHADRYRTPARPRRHGRSR